MDNKLIIITSSIGGMGGAQMYVANKVKFFQSRGWEVFVFYYFYTEKILLNELERYENNYLPDLKYPIQYVPFFRKKEIVSQIERFVKPNNSNLLIESQLTNAAYWAEYIASCLNARHVVNNIEERIPVLNEDENKFFEFKLLHGDIMNATPKRLHTLFKFRYKEGYSEYTRTVSIPCANVVSSDIEDTYSFNHCDYTILSIGRLDKPYIPTLSDEVKRFASMIGNKTINMIYIGGSHDGSMEIDIPKGFENIHNVRCYMLGYVFPIPQALIKRADVAVSCANSVLVSAKEGIPTIVVDVDDYNAVGVFGYTTNSKLRRTVEKKESISHLLYSVLIDDCLKGIRPNLAGSEDYNKVFGEEESFYMKGNCLSYFDINSIYSRKTRMWSQTKYVIRKIMGPLIGD